MVEERTKDNSGKNDSSTQGATVDAALESTVEEMDKATRKGNEPSGIARSVIEDGNMQKEKGEYSQKDNKVTDNPSDEDQSLLNRYEQHGGSGSYDDSDRQSNHQHLNTLSEQRAQKMATDERKKGVSLEEDQ